MDFTHFIFAFYVFVLVCGAIWFYGRVTRFETKKDKSSYEKEHRLFVMYQNVEDMLDSFEEYAEDAKSGLDERLNQVESLIENLRRELESHREAAVTKEPGATPAREERPEEADTEPAPVVHRHPDTAAGPDHTQQMSISEPDPGSVSRADMEKLQKSSKSPSDKPKQKTSELIQQYAEQGMNMEEIAKALGISKREVSLIMEIKKIHV